MIDYHKELHKFKPVADVKRVADAEIDTESMEDIMDLLRTLNTSGQGVQSHEE